jgi:hypothetical protein
MDEIRYGILDLLYEDYYNPWELEVQIAARSLLIPALEDLINQGLIGCTTERVIQERPKHFRDPS